MRAKARVESLETIFFISTEREIGSLIRSLVVVWILFNRRKFKTAWVLIQDFNRSLMNILAGHACYD